MTAPVPAGWEAHRERLAILEKAVDWELLRRWTLSEVYRVTLSSGETVIAKWGKGTEANELKVYRDVVEPLGVPAPRLLDAYRAESGGVMLLEDCGVESVHRNPRPEYFYEAARELARIRRVSIAGLASGALDEATLNAYRVCDLRFTRDLETLLKRLGSESAEAEMALGRALSVLPAHIRRLYRRSPVALVHDDFHAKNLMVSGDGILLVDWASAHLSPHLGDLSVLMSEASEYGADRDQVLEAYRDATEAGTESDEELAWQVSVGGACWAIRALWWLVDNGVEAVIPGSRTWVPSLISDIEKSVDELEANPLPL